MIKCTNNSTHKLNVKFSHIWRRKNELSWRTCQTRALRAHTPHVPRICIIVLGHMLLTTFTYAYEASRAHEQKAHA